FGPARLRPRDCLGTSDDTALRGRLAVRGKELDPRLRRRGPVVRTDAQNRESWRRKIGEEALTAAVLEEEILASVRLQVDAVALGRRKEDRPERERLSLSG